MPRPSNLLAELLLACCLLPGCCAKDLWQTEGEIHHDRNLPVYFPPSRPFAPDSASPQPPPEVRTVLHPDAPRRYISLAECIALALENGRVAGTPLRVLAYDPAIVGTDIERSLSKFDALWRTSMVWNTIDEPVGTALQRLQTTEDVFKDQAAVFQTQLIKPLPTGGWAGVLFRTDYSFSNTIQTLNPLYRPRLQFTFEQPLLQGSGVDINQLLATHPDAVLPSLPGTGAGAPGILLARIAFDQSRDRFVGNVQEMLFEVEQAYWNLYFSYWGLYARDTTLKQAIETYTLARKFYEAGKLRIQDFAQIEQQYFLLRTERLRALGESGGPTIGAAGTPIGNVGQVGVLEAERLLRFVVGLPPEDGTRLIPTDVPTRAAVWPDWSETVNTALTNRPELIESRRALRAAELVLTRARNLKLPDLRFFSSYDLNGIGSHLDGGDDPTNALHSLASNRFHDWTLGLRLDVPIGFRDAYAQARAAELQVQRQMTLIHDQEKQAMFAVQRSYRQLILAYQQIEMLTGRRKAAETQYQALLKEFQSGETNEVFVLLQGQRSWDESLRQERAALFDYNIALADFHRQTGTLLDYDDVRVEEGPLPTCAQDRASVHIHEREKAKVFRERPSTDGKHAVAEGGPIPPAGLKHPAADELAPVPKMLQAEGLNETPDTLPPPTPVPENSMTQPGDPTKMNTVPADNGDGSIPISWRPARKPIPAQ
jgi:outer membrane protein TolC